MKNKKEGYSKEEGRPIDMIHLPKDSKSKTPAKIKTTPKTKAGKTGKSKK